MSIRPRPYASAGVRYGARRPTFIPRAPVAVGARGGGSGLSGLLQGIACPLLCLGCLAALALLGLFATMIAAAAYMSQIQQQIRSNAGGAGSMFEMNISLLFSALLCSIYLLTKHRRGGAVNN